MKPGQELSVEDLQNIKNPIIFYRDSGNESILKIRILYPLGKCEYMWVDPQLRGFRTSCFQSSTLALTVKAMVAYDPQYCIDIKYILIDELD